MLDRRTPATLAVLAGAAVLAFGGAFAAGRLTAPSAKRVTPTIGPATAAGAPASLPHLSRAVPLAAFRPAPAPAVRTVSVPAAPRVRRTPKPKPRPRRSQPEKPKPVTTPVDITGSG